MLTKIRPNLFDNIGEPNSILHLEYMSASSEIYSVLFNVMLSVWEITLDAV
jgi:hypothetical protein